MEYFQPWGFDHLTVLLLIAIVPLSLGWWSRRDPAGRRAIWISRAFALLLLAQLTGWFFGYVVPMRLPWTHMLPLQLCDWALIACVIACWTRRQLAFELAYFWGLAGTFQGLLTPEITYGFPSPRCIFFFVGHGAIVGSVLFLVAGPGLRPHWVSVVRAYAAVLLYGAMAGTINAIFGTNYGYLASKPGVPSLLDYLGPWPWYIASLAGLGIVFFVALYAPWAVRDRLCLRKTSISVGAGLSRD